MIQKFLTYMKECGWNVEMKEKQSCDLPETVKSRYEHIPEIWFEFITTVQSIVSSDETTWFLCEDDYDLQKDKAFQWNEWELISLESIGNDAEWENEIKEFWNMHLPIILSVKDGYSYYAVSMENGSIVKGNEPEFEECEWVADSFEDFMKKIMNRELQL